MSGHTPGPWIWKDGQASITRSWNGADHQVAAVDYKKLAWHEDSNCAGRESGANARLIAAAPDMLAALEKFIDYENAMDGMDDIDGMLIYAEFSRMAHIAIAKATK